MSENTGKTRVQKTNNSDANSKTYSAAGRSADFSMDSVFDSAPAILGGKRRKRLLRLQRKYGIYALERLYKQKRLEQNPDTEPVKSAAVDRRDETHSSIGRNSPQKNGPNPLAEMVTPDQKSPDEGPGDGEIRQKPKGNSTVNDSEWDAQYKLMWEASDNKLRCKRPEEIPRNIHGIPVSLKPKYNKDLGSSINWAYIQKQRDSLTAFPMRISPDIDTSIQSARGGGKALSQDERAYFEPRFDADFSAVKIHTGARANSLSKSLNARAFTSGSDIFFGNGQYNPDSVDGKKLMAHELTHTLQQAITGKSTGAGATVIRKAPRSIQGFWETVGGLYNKGKSWAANKAKEIAKNPQDFLKKALIDWFKQSLKRTLWQFGPFSWIFYYGLMGFLHRIQKAGGIRYVIQLIKKAGTMIFSPAFIWNYLNGLLEGFFIKGLWGTISTIGGIFKFLFYTLPKGVFNFVTNIGKYIARLNDPSVREVLSGIKNDVLTAVEAIKNSAISSSSGFFHKIKSAAYFIGGTVKTVATQLLAFAKNSMYGLGEKMASSLISFFSQPKDKATPVFGKSIGLGIGYLLFEVISTALTGGISAAVKGALGIIKIIGKLFSGAIKAMRGAINLLKQIKPFFNLIASKIKNLSASKWITGIFGTKASAGSLGLFKRIQIKITRLIQLLKKHSIDKLKGKDNVTDGATKLLPTTRESLLNSVTNPKLRNLVNQLYRPGAKIGSGSTADAIRYELRTRQLLSPSGHFTKGIQMRKALLRLTKGEHLNATDQGIAKNLLIDLQNALSGF